ncbi:MAG: TrkA family potassium uptake protein [Alkalibacterium sp.]|uniref:potassium channel family protein n=1 Tax=Alkalibacterium sp. TaxID=1872447 RepID=UPI003970DAA0
MGVFNKKERYILIIGSGRLGASLANDLSEREENVIIVDADKSSFRKLSPSFGGLTVTGDGTDLTILKEAQIERADVVVVVTDNDNSNIMISQIAKIIFKKDQIISRLYDPDKKSVYEEFDIDLIYPAILSVNEINRLLKGINIEEN